MPKIVKIMLEFVLVIHGKL